MEVAIIAARIVQFAAATVLFGAPLFLLYGLKSPERTGLAWARPLMVAASLVLLVAAAAALLGQTAAMAGDPAAALDWTMLSTVVLETPFGLAIAGRALGGAAGLVLCLALGPGTLLWLALTTLGAFVVASFAWSGHGAATEGPGALLHLVADVLHLLAAGVWFGALAALVLMLRPGQSSNAAASQALHGALAGFSGVGSAVVATLILTGLVNSWFLVGLEGIGRMASSPYGQLLIAKLVLFAGMLALAAANRFRHTPALAAALNAGAPGTALPALRRSVAFETALGLGVLGLVGVLGTLAPVAAE
jgi:putative copper resistance protein D